MQVRERRRPHQADLVRRIQQHEHEHIHPVAAADQAGEHNGEQQCRQGKHEFHHAGDQPIHPAARIRGKQTEYKADRHRPDSDHHRACDGRPGAGDSQHEHVTTQRVRAPHMTVCAGGNRAEHDILLQRLRIECRNQADDNGCKKNQRGDQHRPRAAHRAADAGG